MHKLLFHFMAISLLLFSVKSMAQIAQDEYQWSLRKDSILPKHLVAQVWTWIKNGQFDKSKMRDLKNSSALAVKPTLFFMAIMSKAVNII